MNFRFECKYGIGIVRKGRRQLHEKTYPDRFRVAG